MPPITGKHTPTNRVSPQMVPQTFGFVDMLEAKPIKINVTSMFKRNVWSRVINLNGRQCIRYYTCPNKSSWKVVGKNERVLVAMCQRLPILDVVNAKREQYLQYDAKIAKCDCENCNKSSV